VLRVADTEDESNRTTDADTAVELRETKGDATLLLVDTGRAGAGMDGIYNAAREVNETALFAGARQLASATIASDHRSYAERAIRRAQGVGRHDSVSPWVEFDFLCRVAAHRHRAGVHVVAEAPARVVLDLEARLVGKTGAEVARRAPDVHAHGMNQADADMMARVGIEDLDVLALLSPIPDLFVGVADRNLS
jgi:hypothetical protein